MGAYASAPEDYDLFASVLDPMIREFHGISAETVIDQKHDWIRHGAPCDLGAIDQSLKSVSMRVRVARNLTGLPLPGAMSRDQRLDLERIASRAIAAFAGFSTKPSNAHGSGASSRPGWAVVATFPISPREIARFDPQRSGWPSTP